MDYDIDKTFISGKHKRNKSSQEASKASQNHFSQQRPHNVQGYSHQSNRFGYSNNYAAANNQNTSNCVTGYASTGVYRMKGQNPYGKRVNGGVNIGGFGYQQAQVHSARVANNMTPYQQQLYPQCTTSVTQSTSTVLRFNPQHCSPQSASLGMQPGWQQMQVSPFSTLINASFTNIGGQFIPGGYNFSASNNIQSNGYSYENYVLQNNMPVTHPDPGNMQ